MICLTFSETEITVVLSFISIFSSIRRLNSGGDESSKHERSFSTSSSVSERAKAGLMIFFRTKSDMPSSLSGLVVSTCNAADGGSSEERSGEERSGEEEAARSEAVRSEATS